MSKLIWITGLAGSGKTTIGIGVFKRLKERKDKLKSDRLDLESLRFFERVSRGFEDIASLEKERIICINGEQKKENIHKEIVEVLKQKLEMN